MAPLNLKMHRSSPIWVLCHIKISFPPVFFTLCAFASWFDRVIKNQVSTCRSSVRTTGWSGFHRCSDRPIGIRRSCKWKHQYQTPSCPAAFWHTFLAGKKRAQLTQPKPGHPVKSECSDLQCQLSCLLGTEKAQLALCVHLPSRQHTYLYTISLYLTWDTAMKSSFYRISRKGRVP